MTARILCQQPNICKKPRLASGVIAPRIRRLRICRRTLHSIGASFGGVIGGPKKRWVYDMRSMIFS
jgi:hypothetical protein